ncbi:MAG TPA: glycosyltransferase family 39 protein [Saprospiraceae bacterium]|nr:glycosyltransferase family 39 protein [Saprospiraceae bacterium]
MKNLFSKEVLWIIALSALLFIPFLGHVHLFDWDEINFAECSREMIVMDDYTRVYVDFKPFWEKPPMFFWLQSTSMKIFGVNEFAARFPNALCGIITLIVLFLCGRKLYNSKFGILWALAYGGSLFPALYFKSGIIDPWFNLFIFLSVYFFIFYHWKRNAYDLEGLKKTSLSYIILSGIFMGLAILTKGQVALMMFIMVAGVYFLMNKLRFYFTWWHVLVFIVAFMLVTLTWYGYETLKNGPWFIKEFIKYQYRLFTTHDAGQKGFFGYHYVVILFGCFPASVFAVRSFFKTPSTNRYDKDFKRWMLILFWVVTILFTIVKSRIIHYSSLAWFPVTFLAAYTFYKWEMKEMNYKKYISYIALFIGGLLSLLLIAVPVIGWNIKKLIPYVKDKFAQANMEADVHWSGFESAIGLLFLATIVVGIIYLNKKQFEKAAWTFFGGTAVVVFLASAIIIPKVERYSQGAAIDFFKERMGEDCYVTPLGYKTYAHLFYIQKPKPVNEQSYDIEWLLHGDIDKPVYFVSKVDRPERFNKYTNLRELYRKNGFVFLKREVRGPVDILPPERGIEE